MLRRGEVVDARSAPGEDGPATRGLRRDAAVNRERILAAAAAAVLREGEKVPLATIAADAGVGVGTLYRRYPERTALMRDLTDRAYHCVLHEAERAAASGGSAIDAIATFLDQMIRRRSDIVLPLVGGPVAVDQDAVDLRTKISDALDQVVARGQRDGVLRHDVSGVDIIITAALLAQPLPNAPDWDSLARRQARLYLDGLTATTTPPLPGQPPSRADLEAAFARTAGLSHGVDHARSGIMPGVQESPDRKG